MKKVLLFLPMIFMCFITMAQKQIIVAGDPVSCESIVRVDSAIKQHLLYTKGLEWIASSYKSTQAVIQIHDKEEGVIIGKSFFTTVLRLGGLYGTKRYNVNYTFKLSFKDGKSKIILFDFFSDLHPVLKNGRITQYPSVFGKHIVERSYTGLIEASKNYSSSVIKSYTDYLITNSKLDF
jgi:hypothetical protein